MPDTTGPFMEIERMSDRFSGQTAVITGGARGIGYAIAKRIIAEGGQVALWDLKGATEAAETLGTNAIGISVDVADEASVTSGHTTTIRAFGQIDILITAAGITGPVQPVQDYSYLEWKRVTDIHLGGVFLCTRSVLDGMIARDYGRIVTVASVAGKEGNPNSAAYSAAKAGIIGYTKALGKELAQTGVRANCIAPGLINTPLMEQLTPAQIDFSLSKIPQGRFGTVEECAALMAFMASKECSFNSGAVFDLSGGRATY